MSLHRFTSRRRLASLLGVLALAGCATDPQPRTDAAQADGQGPAGTQPIEASDVPARALTLFEQAVASMAGGDTIDANSVFRNSCCSTRNTRVLT